MSLHTTCHTTVACPRCATLAAQLKALELRLAELEQRNAELERKLAAASKNSQTSSKPPSSDITNPEPKPKKPGPRKKRKKGGQPGHARHERPLIDESAIDHLWEWRHDACPCCAGRLQDAKLQEPERFQQIELGPKPVVVVEHRPIMQWCPRCKKVHLPQLPEHIRQAGLTGPRLTALVGWLKGVCHMSFSSIRKYFRDVIGVPISRGMLSKLVQRVSASLRDPYDELLALLGDEDVLNVDETGHKENGQRLWTWCFRASLYTLFKISPSRGSDVLVETLGADFDGLLGCDFFSAYRKYMRLNENVKLQFCLAHLIRDIKFLVTHPNASNREYGEKLLNLFRKLFRTIHRREEYASDATFRRELERICRDVCWVSGMELVDTREAYNLNDRFCQHVESYFRFISTPEIEPTNNLAEQAIRFVAIHRRMTQGTRSDKGQRWFERICTVVVTCEQQGRSAFEYLCEAVTCFLSGNPAPSLLPPLDST
jgi:transposase